MKVTQIQRTGINIDLAKWLDSLDLSETGCISRRRWTMGIRAKADEHGRRPRLDGYIPERGKLAPYACTSTQDTARDDEVQQHTTYQHYKGVDHQVLGRKLRHRSISLMVSCNAPASRMCICRLRRQRCVERASRSFPLPRNRRADQSYALLNIRRFFRTNLGPAS